jgi:tetratricopeptide (TPR) repeat protein
VRLSGDQTYDRAHNLVWEWWVSGGLLGVAALLLLYGAAYGVGFRYLGLLADRSDAVRLGLCLGLGGLLGLGAPLALGEAPYAALGLPAGFVAGAAVYAALARRGTADAAAAPAGAGPGRWAMITILGALTAHLVEGSLGLPTISAELLFWVLLGIVAAVGRRERGAGASAAEQSSALALLDGLALATVAFAPLLLPRPPVRSAEGTWPLLLLPLATWLAADLLAGSAGGAAYLRRAGLRLAVVAGLVVLVVPAMDVVGGPTLAFGALLVATTLALCWLLAGRAAAARETEPWRWLVYGSVGLLAAVGVARLAVWPVLADAQVRAGREAAARADLVTAERRFDQAKTLWPAQPGLALAIAGFWRDSSLAADRPPAERDRAFERATAELRAALAMAPDEALALLLANLHRDRAASLPPGPARAAQEAAAAAAYATARRVFPRNPSVLGDLARSLEQSGRPTEAQALYDDVADLDPASLPALAGRARLAAGRGDLDGAYALLRQFLADRPDDAPAVERALDVPADPAAVGAALVLLDAAAGDAVGARRRLAGLRREAPDDTLLAALGAWLDRHEAG